MGQPTQKSNLFLVGAVKAGTTTLYKAIGQHPQVFCSPIKETYHFAPDVCRGMPKDMRQHLENNYQQHLLSPDLPVHDALVEEDDAYAALFAAATGESVLAEGTVANLYSQDAARLIHEYNPDARIMMVLRDPVERAFSHYLMDVRDSSVTDDFLHAFQADLERKEKGWGVSHLYFELGHYADQVQRYLDYFGADRVLVLRFADMKQDFTGVLKCVFEFAGIDASLADEIHPPHANRAKTVRYPLLMKQLRRPVVQAVAGKIVPVSLRKAVKSNMMTTEGLPRLTPQIKEQLLPIFEDSINQLEQMLGDDFNAWRAA